MRADRFAFLVVACLGGASAAAAPPLTIVAAESVYGDVASQVAGPGIAVRSILSNPAQDPHAFEASPSVARALADARITVANGIGYDPWMDRLLAASPAPGRAQIAVAALLGARDGENPHLWYDPRALPAVAVAVAQALDDADPAHAAGYAARRDRLLASLKPVRERIEALRRRFAGVPVTATEPVFGDMARAVGLADRNAAFQRAVMNDAEPAASEVAAFEDDLRQHRVRVLIYNSQASDPAARRMLALAQAQHISVLGVTETLPPGMHAQAWLLGELDRLEAALAAGAGRG